jgi:transcriptional regulator of acetoin/glycerol metabolism
LKKHGSLIEVDDLVGIRARRASQPSVSDEASAPAFSIKPLAEHVTDYVSWAYASLGYNKARTARELEIDRVTLYRKLRQATERD